MGGDLVPAAGRPRRRGLADVADHGDRARQRATGHHPQLHGREVLGLVHHDVAVGAGLVVLGPPAAARRPAGAEQDPRLVDQGEVGRPSTGSRRARRSGAGAADAARPRSDAPWRPGPGAAATRRGRGAAPRRSAGATSGRGPRPPRAARRTWRENSARSKPLSSSASSPARPGDRRQPGSHPAVTVAVPGSRGPCPMGVARVGSGGRRGRSRRARLVRTRGLDPWMVRARRYSSASRRTTSCSTNRRRALWVPGRRRAAETIPAEASALSRRTVAPKGTSASRRRGRWRLRTARATTIGHAGLALEPGHAGGPSSP